MEKHEKIVTSCKNMIATASKAVKEVLMLAVDNRSDEKLQRAYEKNCVVRLHVLDI